MAANVIQELKKVIKLLDELKRPWALVGGFAVSARTEPRTTRDVDVVITVDTDKTAEEVVQYFFSKGYQVHALVEQKAKGRIATVRLKNVQYPVLLDILFASSGIEQEITQEAERMEILPGVILPVATSHHLASMKLLAREDRHRPQDYDDLRHLLKDADEDLIQKVRAANELITQRGFNRGRDLNEMLAIVLEEFSKN